MKKIFILGESNSVKSISEVVNACVEGYHIMRFSDFKQLVKSISVDKPQLIIAPYGLVQKAKFKSLILRYEFVPLIVYDCEITDEKKLKILYNADTVQCLRPPYDKESIIQTVRHALWQGLAKEELWDNQMDIAQQKFSLVRAQNIFMTVFVLCAAFILGFVFKDKVLVSRETLPVIATIPYGHISGMFIDDGNLWVCDWQTQCIYKNSVKKGGRYYRLDRAYSFPGIKFSGITLGEEFLWSLNPWERKIVKHKLDSRLTILSSYDTPGPNPTGIVYHDKHIWICDNATDKIYKLDEQNDVVRSYDAPGPNPIGIFSDGKTLWSADSETGKIYRHIMDDNLSTDFVFVPEIQDKISCITGDKNNIYIANEKENRIYRYAKEIITIQ